MERDEGRKEAHCGAVGSLIDHEKTQFGPHTQGSLKENTTVYTPPSTNALKHFMLTEKLSSHNLFPHIKTPEMVVSVVFE